MSKSQDFELKPFPRSRQLMIDQGRVARRKPAMYGLVSFDVTNARATIRSHKEKTGETLSFTGFIVNCLAQAVDENKMVHAYRNWRNKLVIFNDVDISVMIEINLEGENFPMIHVIKAANRKNFREVHDEIRRVQGKPKESRKPRSWWLASQFVYLPSFLRGFAFWLVGRMPKVWKKAVGTVVVTSVGMFGKGGGWGNGPSAFTLGVTIGGISERPGVVDGEIKVREYLDLTLSFDHVIVDGAPAARFAGRFKELVEGGKGLKPLV